MRKLTLVIAALLLVCGMCFAADPAEGFWISIDEKSNEPTAGWQIWAQNGKLNGKILSVAGKPQDVIADGGKGKS